MARNRNSVEASSLELLLDTMCNTFGGVMFIAISLVVISTYIPELVEKSTPLKSASRDVKEIREEIEKLGAKLSELKQSRSVKEKTLAALFSISTGLASPFCSFS